MKMQNFIIKYFCVILIFGYLFVDAKSQEPKVLFFDGKNDFIDCPHIELDKYKSFTIEVWIRNWYGYILSQGYAGDPENSVWLSTLKGDVDGCGWEANQGNPNYASYVDIPDPNQWMHIALVFDEKNQYVFSDGNLVNKQEAPKPGPLDSSRNFIIGGEPVPNQEIGWNFGTGFLKSIRVSKNARYKNNFTPNSDLNPDSKSVLLYTLESVKEGTLFDLSKNKLHGSIRGVRIVKPSEIISASISGYITDVKENTPYPGLTIIAHDGEKIVSSAQADIQGRYKLMVPPGEYTIRLPRGQGIRSPDELVLTVSAGQESKADFAISMIEIPEILVRSMALYKSHRSYRDTTVVERRMVKPGMDNRMTSPVLFLFEKPNRIRNESIIEAPMGEIDLFSNGEKMVSYMSRWKQYMEMDAPGVLTSADLQSIQSYVLKNIIISDNPLKDLKKNIEEVKVIGTEKLDGILSTIIELTQTASSLKVSMVPGRVGEDMLIPVRLWIGSNDYLIRKVAYELDMEQIAMSMPEEQRARMGDYYKGLKMSITEMHTEIEIDPVFSDKDFIFIPPKGAQLVDNFHPPSSSRPKESKLIGSPAPDFSLKDIDGDVTKLSDFEGKVVLVDFWATWCGPCVKAMPHLQTLFEIYKDDAVIVLGINSWEREKDKVKPFLKEHKITYRILLDSNNDVISKYGVMGIPTFFVIDKKSIIRYSYTGMPPNRQIIQQNIETLLTE